MRPMILFFLFIISNGWWILLTSNSWLYLPFAYLFMFGMKFSFFLFCMCVCIESGTTIIELPIHWIHSTKRIAGKTLSMMMLLLLLLEIGARVTRDVKQQMFFFCYTNTIYLCVSFFLLILIILIWWMMKMKRFIYSRTLFLSEWIMSYYDCIHISN